MNLTLSQGWSFYIAEHCVPAGVKMPNIESIKRRTIEFWGADFPLKKLDRGEGRKYRAHRTGQGRAEPTARKEMAMLGTMIRHNVAEKRLKEAPKFEMPDSGQPRERFLTSEECEAVMAAAKVDASPIAVMFWLLALETAARAGAIRELTIDRVDFERRVVDYRVPAVRYKNKRRGQVAISSHLYQPLFDFCAGRDPAERVLGARRDTYVMAKRVLKRAGIDEYGVAQHVSRKTWASHAAGNDVPMVKIAAVLHDTVTTTAKHYTHIKADQLHSTMDFRTPEIPAPAPDVVDAFADRRAAP